MQKNVLQLMFTNETDKKQSASLFQLFSDNIFVKAESTYTNCSGSNYFNNLKLWLLKNKFDAELMRLQFITNPSDNKLNHIYFRKFTYRSGNPFGSSMEIPLFTIGESFSPKQYQSGIVDVPIDAEFDGYSTDVMFDIYPKERIVITLFEKLTEEKKKKYKEHVKKVSENKIEIDKGLTPFKGFPVVVENTSDEDLVIDLFNPDHYRKLVEYDKNGLVYSVFDGRESFGVKNCHVPIEKGKTYNVHLNSGKGNDDEKEYNYIATIQSIKSERSFKYYDCIRIVNPNTHKLNDIVVNGRTIKTNGYTPDEEVVKSDIFTDPSQQLSDPISFTHIAVDVILDQQDEFNSFIATVPPQTNMMFSFGKRMEIENAKPQRLVSGYSNESILQ